jgi:leucyl-tRNA synthetase
MNERRKPYPFDRIEPKWQAIWDERGAFRTPNPGEKNFDPAKPKFYILDMFPYPSGAGLHVGHPEGYTATDIVARYKRMRGFNVLHPMGWDAFGLPAEQYAIKTGQHPAITTRENIAKFKAQLKQIGFSYDWEREVNTTDPRYFKWTQWIFLKLYHSWFNPKTQKAEPISTYHGDDPDKVRLAYLADVAVNWCPELGTVLANEEVIDGKSEVGGFPVVRRPMRQWMLRITAYAERLIAELDGLDWPQGIKLLQANWIGRSEGAEIRFRLAENDELRMTNDERSTKHEIQTDASARESRHSDIPSTFDIRHSSLTGITVFTTRPDTLYGANYMVLAPEHPLVDQLTTPERQAQVQEYRENVAAKSDLERTDLAKEKTGVFIGAYAINPVDSERIPIWIADYVLMGYGTGAIMGVPGHDERDLEFARNFEFPILPVVQAPGKTPEESIGFLGDGIAINSPIIDGLPTPEAKKKIIAWLHERGHGHPCVRYKLRDWLFSRQRYWGEPFPIIWRGGKHEALPESELPLELPALADFKPTGTGEPPLAKAKDWIRYSDTAVRETNTMPQWAGSCWYYLRFCDPQNEKRFVGEEAERYWMGGAASRAPKGLAHTSETLRPTDEVIAELPVPVNSRTLGGVDLYVGGTEHAVLHLLYARFWHKVLFDLGYLSTPEPFQRLINQGMILGEDGRKMSKRWGNVIDPSDVIEIYGADAFRCYEMFMGPLEQMKPWSMKGVEGVARFLARVWRLMMEENQAGEWILSTGVQNAELDRAQLKVVHATIKKLTEDIETLSFNTAIAQMMILVNAFTNAAAKPVSAMRTLLILLNPFAPHITSELWEIVNQKLPDVRGDITAQPWPRHDEQFLVENEIEIALQVNGKVRDRIVVALDATEEELRTAALANARVREFTEGKTIRKVVVISQKLVNVVAN